jgi:hypothetical protein
MKYYTERWHDTLTSGQRLAWATYAAAVPVKNRIGENVYLTGFNWYLAVNIVRAQAQNSKCDDGPTTLTLVESDPGFAVSASAATQKLTITLTDALPWRSIVAAIIAIYQGTPQGATRNYFNGPWQYAGNFPGNAVAPYEVTAPMTLIQGQKVWVYGRIATGPTDSRISAPMVASCTVGA